ncbi:hypothetical protein ACFPES_03905 [Paenibacillus sp. GCM10023248]|uniref:hypothetical protein n=1 Tax=unclassified Paenibacillus TaxID=185978 RepID=UPI002377E27C|nr:hypothetical protein [Paenibacillus sp. MAHUQ-63]MDD9266172.1 hypothetical protein [Paenibacillus sp. MAHUQ-63]
MFSEHEDFIINNFGILIAESANALPLITIPKIYDVEEVGAIYEVYSAGIVSGKPIIIANTDGELVLYRLPDELLKWAEMCIEAFKDREVDVFPDKVEFGILDGHGYYANFLYESD